MEKLTADQAANRLDISVDDLRSLVKKGLIHSVGEDTEELYSGAEIAQIESRNGLSLSEEASMVDTGIQREMVGSIAFTRNVLRGVGGVLLGYLVLVAVFATAFLVKPVETAEWLGIVKTKVNELSEINEKTKVLGVQTSSGSEVGSPIQTIFQPIGKVSLGLVKNINPSAYAQVSKIAILDPNDVLAVDTSGAIVPELPIKITRSSLLQIGSSEVIANLNATLLQGKQPGVNVGDIAIVGESFVPTITTRVTAPALSGLSNLNLSGTAGITNANLANSSVIIETSGPLSGGGTLALGERISLSCPTCVVSAASLFNASSSDALSNKTISGLTNTFSDIPNSGLSNSSLSVLAGTGLSSGGLVSLGGSVSLSLPDVGSAATYGSSNLIPVFTTDAQGRVMGVVDTAISGLSTASFGSPNISQWTNNVGFITNSSSDTLSNKTISGLTNTISNIPNSGLSNSSISVLAGAGLSNGGLVSLGGSVSLSLPNVGSAATYGSGSLIPVFTTDSQGRVMGVVDTAISGLSTTSFASANISQWSNNSGFITSSSSDVLSNKTLSTALNTITGLTNINLSGTAGITNANLANAAVSLLGNSGSGSVALGGSLSLAGAGISSVVASGSTLTITTTEADTLASVTGRGSLSSTALTLNGGITTTTTTALSLDSGTTGNVSIGTGANAKTVTIGNNTGGSGVNINSGTGNVNFSVGGSGSSGKVQIGSSGTSTPDLLVLDSGSADPTGINGGVYYNSSSGKFRCYENSAWANCITPSGSDLQHAASYDTDEAFTNIPTGGAQVTLGTISVTPSTATGDIYVTGWADVYSSNGVDQPLNIVIETTSNCSGTTVGNASVTYTITSGASAVNDRGTIRVSGIAVDAGASAHPYSLCAAVSSGAGDSDIENWGIEATVIDTGADLAEMYSTRDVSIEAGDVVSIDEKLQIGVKKSQVSYDGGVLGVISTKAGLVIGGVRAEGVGAVPVALAGRIPVKVSTQNGKINVGDYLTSSSMAGVAMRATRQGAIIGIAMNSFEGEDVGQILVFVKSGTSMGSGVSLGTQEVSYLSERGSQLDNQRGDLSIVSVKEDESKEEASKEEKGEISVVSLISRSIAEVFNRTVEFFGEVVFRGGVSFLGHAKFGKDTAGVVIIKAGEREVSVRFEKEYDNSPVVTASINGFGEVEAETLPSYGIYEVDKAGFKIKILEASGSNIYFSWMALGAGSDIWVKEEEPVVTEIELIPMSDEPYETSEEAKVLGPSIEATESGRVGE